GVRDRTESDEEFTNFAIHRDFPRRQQEKLNPPAECFGAKIRGEFIFVLASLVPTRRTFVQGRLCIRFDRTGLTGSLGITATVRACRAGPGAATAGSGIRPRSA